MPRIMANVTDGEVAAKPNCKFAVDQRVYVIACDQDNTRQQKKYYGNIHERMYDGDKDQIAYTIIFVSDDGPDGEIHLEGDVHACLESYNESESRRCQSLTKEKYKIPLQTRRGE